MRLRRKLLLALVGPAVLLVAVGVIGVSSLGRVGRSAEAILSDNYRSIQSSRRMERTLREMELELTGPQVSRGRLAKLSGEFERALARCEANITEEGEVLILRDVRRLWKELLQQRVLPGEERGEAGAAGSAAGSSLFRRIDALVDLNERAMFVHERQTRQEARLTVVLMWSSLAGSLALLFLFAFVIAGRISRPILGVARDLHRTLGSEGRPGGEPGNGGDEIQRLRAELGGLLARLERHEREQKSRFTRLEGRLVHVMEGVPEGIILLAPDRKVLAVNAIGRQILGLGDQSCVGQGFLPLVQDPEIQDQLAPALQAESAGELALREVRRTIGGADHIYRPRLLPLRSAEGAAEGFLLFFWDVTEEQRFEESKRRFIAMLSHQLKTPMTSLTMSVNLLDEALRDASGEETTSLLSMAREDCSALSSLIGQLIDTARGTPPDLALNPMRVDIVRLLRGALRPLGSQAKDKGIVLNDALGADPVFLDVDPVKFPWVVTNIVGNALRYTPEGGSVTVNLRAGARQVEFAVADTGVGIAPENLRRIFLPFTSADPERDSGSHGLGLAIAREIVEAHRGTIAVDSAPGQGARFTITLPGTTGALS